MTLCFLVCILLLVCVCVFNRKGQEYLWCRASPICIFTGLSRVNHNRSTFLHLHWRLCFWLTLPAMQCGGNGRGVEFAYADSLNRALCIVKLRAGWGGGVVSVDERDLTYHYMNICSKLSNVKSPLLFIYSCFLYFCLFTFTIITSQRRFALKIT